MEDPARMVDQPLPDLGVFVGGVVVGDGVDDFAGRDGAFHALRNLMNSAWVCFGMQRPTTVPSRILRAANSVVVPLRL